MNGRVQKSLGDRWPRAMRREIAASYIGVSPSKFDGLVKEKRIPAGKECDGVKRWAREWLDEYLDDIFYDDGESGKWSNFAA